MIERLRQLLRRGSQQKSAAFEAIVPGYSDGKPSQEMAPWDNLPFAQLYTKLATVYAGIYAISSAVASVPLRVYRRNRDGDPEELPDHPLQKLLDQPHDLLTGYDLRESMAAFLEISGNSYLLMEGGQVETGGPPETIYPLMPHRVNPVSDKKDLVRAYAHIVGERAQRFPREQVLHLKYFSPVRDILGQGSVEPAQLAAIVDLWAIWFNKSFFKRGATFSALLSTEEELGEVEAKRILDSFKAQYTGADNAWQVKLLTHGFKLQSAQPTHTDMLFGELRRMNREEILMSLGVPPVMVTLLDGATYANAQEQKRQFWEVTILPKLRKMQERITKDLAARYGPDIFVAFDTGDVAALQEDREAIARTGQMLLQSGAITPNELRIWVSTGTLPALDPVRSGDVTLLPFNLMPADDAGAPPAPPTAPETEPEAEDPEKAVERFLDAITQKAGELQATEERNIRRKAQWKAFDRKTAASARMFARVARAMFQEQEAAVLAGLEEALARGFGKTKAIDEIELIIDSLYNGNVARFKALYQEVVEKAGTEALANVGAGDITFSLLNPDTVRFLDAEGARLVTNVDEVTKKRLAVALAEGTANNENLLQLSDRVKATFDASRYRANVIARTEAIKAHNFGAVEAYKQTGGLVERKRWLATPDGDTREDHADADGSVVSVNEGFQVGPDVLAYPGDPSGSPENVINCRCTVEPILQGEEDTVGMSFNAGAQNGRPTR